ncbi:GAF domain-containing protein [Levilinea saccharolytica]|uniref:GAF domain-containing protein n=1 Tax=Levilinea saccharolytica TaxID=229921 RepID=A0A0P6Y1N6_9CHLR|nr:GAF domain-containing protein [Levilinea saccharolytica]KPL82990.1 hypothetical protein ADN01_08780 [Levilinea saccharolytica]GAP17833.1 protein containing PAS domain S-box [Levilinea saccharolytica]
MAFLQRLLEKKPKPAPSTTDKQFRGSLARNVIFLLVLLSIIPLLITGTATVLRSRELVRNQTSTQLESIVKNQATQLAQVAATSTNVIAELGTRESFIANLRELAEDPTSESKQFPVLFQLLRYQNSTIGDTYANVDHLFVLLPDGSLVASTNDAWKNLNVATAADLMRLVGRNDTLALYNPAPLYFNRLVIFSTLTVFDDQKNPLATVVCSSLSNQPKGVLISAGSFFPSANAYMITENRSMLGINPTGEELIQLQISPAYEQEVNNLLGQNRDGRLGSYVSLGGIPVFAYTKWIPELQLALTLEVPERVVYAQTNLLTPTNIILFGLTLLVAGVIASIVSAQIVRPILDLVSRARSFSAGNWDQRARVTRRDEIGLLAHSFNGMVEQLSDLYRSLEQKVEQRTQQVRMASEVAQMATSSFVRDEIVARTVNLVIERFDYLYASIFLIDDTGTVASMEAEDCRVDPYNKYTGLRLRLGSDSLVGWVAANNQARVIQDVSNDSYPQQVLQELARSEAALPISIGNQVLGVLEVQSDQPEAFDPDVVPVLQTLANQIASGLQNIRLLESTQINLQETSLLYRTSRQITQAQGPEEATELLISILQEIPYVSGVYSVEEDHLRIIHIHDPKDRMARSTAQGITLPLQHLASQLTNRSMVLLDDLSQRTELQSLISFFARRGCVAAAIFPIHVNGVLSKVIVLSTREARQISETALQPFANLIEVTSTTLGRFGILSSLETKVNELQILSEASRGLSNEIDRSRLFEQMHAAVREIVGGDVSFYVATYNAEQQTIEIPYLYDNTEVSSIPPFPLGEGITSVVIKSLQPLLLNRDTERQAQALGAKLVGKTPKSWLGIPLIVANQAVGALVVQDMQTEERFTEDHLRLFNTLAPQMATAMRNADLLDQMSKALHDYDQERFLLNTLLKNLPDLIYFKDAAGQFIRVSDSFAKRFGYDKPESLVGMTDFDLLGQDIGSKIFQEEMEIIRLNEPQLGKVEQEISFGKSPRWRMVNRIPMLTESGDATGLLGITHDITDLKQAQELAQKNARQLRIAAEVARDTSSTLSTRDLMQKSVNLIRDRFGFYHASIFLLDPLGEYAVLQESTGLAGERLKEAKHRLAVGSRSIVGQATQAGEPMVINNVHVDPNYFPNPLLPETSAELVIPLKSAGRVIGAIDVQSTQVDAFLPEDISILEIMADQLAIAVINAQLYDQAQDTLARHRLLHKITAESATTTSVQEALVATARSLQTNNPDDRIAIYLYNENRSILELRATAGYKEAAPLPPSIRMGEGVIGRVGETRTPRLLHDVRSEDNYLVIDETTRSELAVPIIYRGNLMGVLNIENPQIAAYDETDQEIFNTLGTNLGTILYNSHLIEEIRQQVERQRVIYETTTRIRRAVDIQNILETTATEVARALGARRSQIAITAGTLTESPAEPTPPNGKKNGKEAQS